MRGRGALAYGIVALTSLWLTRPFWMPGGYVVGFDTFSYSGPNLLVTEEAVRAGRLPVLNDLIFGGVPHLGNPQTGVLYPAHLLTLVFDTNRAMGLIVTAHVVLLGVGLVALARRLRLHDLGATVAGVVGVAAGASLTKTVQFEQIMVLAWAPLLLASVHAVLTSSRPWRAAAALAATTAAMLLAGHPQLVYELALLAAASTLAFAIGGERWRRLPIVAAGVGAGALIALPQLVSTLHATADSAISGGRPLDELGTPALALLPSHTARAMLGTIRDQDPAAFAGGFESIGFVGVTVAVLAVVGITAALMRPSTRAATIVFVGFGVLALCWSFGPRTFVFRVAYELAPGFDLARASARWVVVVVLLVAMFAGVGADAVSRGATRAHCAAASGGVLLVAAAIAVGPLVTADRASAVIWAVTAVVVVAVLTAGALLASAGRPQVRTATVAVVVLVAGIELVLMSLHSIPQALRTDAAFTSHRSATTTWLAAQDEGSTLALTDDGAPIAYQVPGMRPNTNVIAGVPSIDGYDGGVQVTTRWTEALRRFTPEPPVELPLRNSVQLPVDPVALARLGVRFVLLDIDRPADVFVPDWEGPRVSDAEFAVYENPAWIGDAVAWPRSMVVDGAPADALREDPLGTASAAIVGGPNAVISCANACAPTGLRLERRSPEHLVVDADLDRESIVAVARQALPGWRVEVDGAPADEVVVDGLFLGVRVPAGDHVVEWRYHSPWLGPTLLVSVLAVAAVIAFVTFDTVRSRADSSSDGHDRPIDTPEA